MNNHFSNNNDDDLDLDFLEFDVYSDDEDEQEEIELIDLNPPRPSKQVVRYRKKKLAKEIFSYVQILAIAVLIAYIVIFHIIVNSTVPTGSMADTIMPGDRIVGLRIAYLFSEPDYGDIIIFRLPDNEEETYIKRIIGVPGDRIEIKSGVLYINNVITTEDYIREPMLPNNYGPYIVPEDCYFCMGDNRNLSDDARFWNNKYVPRDNIIGKALFRYYPEFEILK